MVRFARLVAWCAASSLLAVGCTPAPTPQPPTLDVAITSPAPGADGTVKVVADGTARATITVAHPSPPADVQLRITTSRGTFVESGTAIVTLNAGVGSATLTLVTCDSRLPAPCAGQNRITASSLTDNGTGTATLSFDPMENCADGIDNDGDNLVDCADTVCAGYGCIRPTGAVGSFACTAGGQCLCSADGGTPEAAETVCNDGVDNDCDGKVDCADTGCAAKACRLASGFNGACSGTTCACPGTAENNDNTCSDTIDNDCDGLTDCQETGCQPVGNNPGKICNKVGHATTGVGEKTCSSISNDGGSSCSVCTVPSGIVEVAEGQTQGGATPTCGDGKDNDCDGPIDCQDPNCANQYCSTTGKTCDGAFQCTCPGGSVETSCNDNVDNDCDGQKDCADTDCRPGANPGAQCGPYGRTCNSGGTCSCSGNGGTVQTNETACGDGFDNDCDGLVDCQDLNCRATGPTYTNGQLCDAPTANPPRVGNRCDGVGNCLCPGGSLSDGGIPPETLCGDSQDNDCDGQVDCQDPDCAGLSCNANGMTCSASLRTCTVCSGNGGTPQAPETTCNDLRDNDCDGLVDCLDANCANQQCSATSNYQCTATVPLVCRDTSTNFSLVLTATPGRIAANGTSTSAISATLRNGTNPLGAATVNFAASSGSVNPGFGVTNGSGVTGTTFTSAAAGGPATVTGAYDAGTAVIYGTISIDQPRLGSIVVANQQYSVMGVKYSSFNETNQITFQLLDNTGQPYPAGLAVDFTHEPKSGSYIGSTANCTASLCTAQGVTNAQGQVQVLLNSGSVASVVYVQASATGGGINATATASNIAIVGAKASGLAASIICTPRNLPGYAAHDCTKSLYAGGDDRVNCTTYFADRFGNVLGRSTLTTFTSEAGAASAPSFTNPSGSSAGSVSVTGYALPLDVPPAGSEKFVIYNDGCGVKTHNPRDGLMTVIVSANGEEGFVDGSNGRPADGVYNAGENFLDIGEPFVDANDNNVRDNNEAYVDSNNSGGWDGPNGVWDSDTTIWASTRVVYTGRAAVGVNGSSEFVFSRWYSDLMSPTPPDPTAPLTYPAFSLPIGPPAGKTTFGVFFSDVNLNQVSPLATYALTIVTGLGSARFLTTPQTAVNGLGMAFTQQYCSDQAGTTGCGSTCGAAPCYQVSQVGGFAYGRYGTVELTAGSQVSDPIVVGASCTLGGVTTQLDIAGRSTP